MFRLNPLLFLRPYLHVDITINTHSYVKFAKRGIKSLDQFPYVLDGKASKRKDASENCILWESSSISQNRIKELEAKDGLHWPRIETHPRTYSIQNFRHKWEVLLPGKDANKDESVCVRGKMMACRIMGTRLIFMDLVQDGKTLQVMANLRSLSESSGVSEESFQIFYHLAQRGDYISVTGYAHRTLRGELSIYADSLPKIISPTLRSLPKTLLDRAFRMRNRHVDLIINRNLQHTIRMRSHVVQYLRDFLLRNRFLEVQTPIIADKATGAIARPFLTNSAYISDKIMALRVAPELWLKRLIIGGFDRVFELGPAFRNEGFDHSHNPEFTTCEFYKAFANLEQLIGITETILSGLATSAMHLQKFSLGDLPEIDSSVLKAPFRRVEFIPAIEEALKEKLPNLESATAQEEVSDLLLKNNNSLPESPTLPRLLDKLSSLYIEPWCTMPTLIMYPPACMAPLAKSFLDPKSNQIVSARAELYVQCHELANMYEEENSPIEQRKKFEEQKKYNDLENECNVDESYLSALEWGLPPTGGWGCGVDRLVMLLTGARRIQDVLSFGGLKNVVSLGSASENKSLRTDMEEKNASVNSNQRE
ncbi:Lysine--tRNA ligase [Golovinomyces cichoracearum]|uniref:Lysyl-tRNA synthetase n=1 Tax=Golovinomyces cichoracearum TaxID=62708 RepID=A0A420IWS0_9PEZI|nr:Lysine--tRNA ligase [Golovinomyces cichoracearum]